jgi:beta-N-acetylhexosaminidase
MGGILKFLPMDEAAIAAIRAGMDLLEICHSPELILRAYESLITEGERSAAFRSLLFERAIRMARKRAAMFSSGVAPALTGRQFETLRTKILRFRDTVMGASSSMLASAPIRTATNAETA